jgi:UDP-2,3-diacylglucosamine pyrophosphatase LpxH
VRYRAIWISDVHLGTRQCDADALLAFLDTNDCDYLYLVGDIIDFWSLRRRPYFVSAFEQALAHEAARRGLAGVVCGHIHRPALRELGQIVYANCGDWVENGTAVVEHPDGEMALVFPRTHARTAEAMAEGATG